MTHKDKAHDKKQAQANGIKCARFAVCSPSPLLIRLQDSDTTKDPVEADKPHLPLAHPASQVSFAGETHGRRHKGAGKHRFQSKKLRRCDLPIYQSHRYHLHSKAGLIVRSLTSVSPRDEAHRTFLSCQPCRILHGLETLPPGTG
jgi:hypothetical protein